MAFVRIFLLAAAALFILQVVSAGVQRRDTAPPQEGAGAGDSDVFNNFLSQLSSQMSELSNSLRSNVEQLANSNLTQMFSDLRSQIDQAAANLQESVRSASPSSPS